MTSDSRAETSDLPADAGKIGLWLFLLSEILLFGAFFSSYFMLRWSSASCRLGEPAWPAADYGSALVPALLNTLVLLTSSFTMVRACAAAQAGDGARFSRRLLETIGLGALFLVIKGFEYSTKIHHGYFPGGSYALANPGTSIFFSFYFVMTGLHAVHVVAGLVWNGLLWSAAGALDSGAAAADAFERKVEFAGIYWHFVDVIWVFLFPLLYLI